MQATQLRARPSLQTSVPRSLSQAAIDALVDLGQTLQRTGYNFTTVTPATHQRVNARALAKGQRLARDLRDVFGWSRPFTSDVMPKHMLELLQVSQQLVRHDGLFQSKVRFASLEGRLFVHSAFPTDERDAVFFGPDTYRFCALIQRWAPARARCMVDLGAGSGAGAIMFGSRASRRVAVDVNPQALAFTRVNAALAGMPVEVVRSDLLSSVACLPDLIVANPPYMRDLRARSYRDGGGPHGENLSVRIVSEALATLPPGGELILYTGTSIVAGVDTLLEAITPILRQSGGGNAFSVTYQELDPDVFGEELTEPPYAEVDRIAVIGMHLRMA